MSPGSGLETIAATRLTVTVVAAVAGLAIGSFLNVVVYRVPRGLSVVAPGSFCPSCRTPIRTVDNVPVIAWLVLRGRCRSCGAPISARYPLVEAATGLVFGAVAWGLGAHPAVAGACALAATLVALAVVELDGEPAPAAVAVVGTGLGVVALAAATAAAHRWWHLGGLLIGVAAGAVALVAWRSVAPGRRPGLPWALVPLGAVAGWAGPVGVAAGLPVAVVVAVVVRSWPTRRRHGDTRGVALGSALGAAVAIGAALAAGSLVGL